MSFPISAVGAPAPDSQQLQPQAKSPVPPAPDPLQDVVQISKQGLAAVRGGDVDHDGDSK
jgi:hypothetical protein